MRALLLIASLLAPAAYSEGQKCAPMGTVGVGPRDQLRKLTRLQAVEIGFVYELVALYALDLWNACSLSGAAVPLIGEEVSPPRQHRAPAGLAAVAVTLLPRALFLLYGKRLVEHLEAKTATVALK